MASVFPLPRGPMTKTELLSPDVRVVSEGGTTKGRKVNCLWKSRIRRKGSHVPSPLHAVASTSEHNRV